MLSTPKASIERRVIEVHTFDVREQTHSANLVGKSQVTKYESIYDDTCPMT